ncbi:NADH-cytochrome b5 reductase [Coniothyrium glycines]
MIGQWLDRSAACEPRISGESSPDAVTAINCPHPDTGAGRESIATELSIMGQAQTFLPVAIALVAVIGGYVVFGRGNNNVEKPIAAARTAVANSAAAAKEEVDEFKDKVLHPKDFREFELEDKTVISHNTAIYRYKLPKPTDSLGLPIGQHISLAADIGPPGKEQVVRSYTPISSDEDKGHVDLIIKSYPTGNISRYVAEMEIGQKIKIRGPKGAMVYTPNLVRHFGMIAGGTGITPMLQIAKAIERGRASGDNTEVDLIFANVNPEDILLKDELDALAAKDPKFRVHYVLNNPPEKWSGGTGFVTADMIKKWLPAPASDVKILLCGPPPMVKAMKAATEGLGFEKARAVSKLEDQVFAF